MLVTAEKESAPGLRAAVGYYAAFVVLGLASASLGPVLPRLAEQVAVSLGAISLLFTARSLGYLTGSLGGGRLYDRVSSHWVMAGGLIALGLALLLFPTAPALWLLVVFSLMLGAGEGIVDVGGNALLVWVFRGGVGPWMNALHFFFGVGAALSPLLVAQAVRVTGGYGWAFGLMALIAVPVVVWLLTQASPTGQRNAEENAGVRTDWVLVGLLVLFLLLYVGAEASYGGWVFTYGTRQGLAAEVGAAYLTSVFWGALTAGRLLAIPLAMRFKPIVMLSASVGGCLASIAAVNLWPGSATVLWIGTVGLGLSMAAVFPTAITLAGSLMNVSGQITGWFLVGASGGAMVVPWLIGQLFERIGPRAVTLTILADLVLLALVFGLVLVRVRTLRRFETPGRKLI